MCMCVRVSVCVFAVVAAVVGGGGCGGCGGVCVAEPGDGGRGKGGNYAEKSL